jgi:hypothetical protein
MDSAPVPINVRCCSNSDQILRRSEMTLSAMCGRLRVGKSFFHVCSIGRRSHVFGLLARHTGPLAIMPSADQVPVNSSHSTMRWHKWVVLIAGSTGSALRRHALANWCCLVIDPHRHLCLVYVAVPARVVLNALDLCIRRLRRLKFIGSQGDKHYDLVRLQQSDWEYDDAICPPAFLCTTACLVSSGHRADSVSSGRK